MPGSRNLRSPALLLLLLAVLLTLGLSELVARRLLGDVSPRMFRFDEEKIFEPVPNVTKVFGSPGGGGPPVRCSLNGLGFRGPEPDLASGAPRVVVYGDSYVLARYVPEERSYPVRLGEALAARRGERVDVWNAGVTGYGPDQSLLRLREELSEHDPDAVVFVVFAGNDFGDLVRNKLFRLGDGGRLVRNAPVLPAELRRSFAPRGGPALLRLWRRAWRPRRAARESPAAATVEEILERSLARGAEEYDEYVLRGDDVVRHPFRDHYDAGLGLHPDSEAARYQVALMEGVLAAVAEAAGTRDTPLLFVFVPHRLDVCPLGGGVDRTRHPSYEPDSKTRVLGAIAGRLGVPCLDLFPVFQGACDRGLYYEIDEHWNENGQELAARRTADVLVDLGLLP